MDPKEWKQRSVGMPLDPDKQRDPDETDGRTPVEGGKADLTSPEKQNAGQRSDMGAPWQPSPELQTGQRDRYAEESDDAPSRTTRPED